jgi:ATP-binding cassette, subfamily B (MDR/TAP), member 1
MAESIAHSDAPTNEKAEVEQKGQQPQKAKKGLFSRKAKTVPAEVSEKPGNAGMEGMSIAVDKDIPPASFASLFRCVA